MLLDRYELVDAALKVVGVGSVGLGAFAVLLLGGDEDDPLFLQVKQAEASVLERYLAPSQQPSHGARVVAGQRRLQAASDILLGWTVGEQGRHWYVRQLQDQKGGAVVEAMTLDDLATWGELCGWALARGHARSGQPAEIAGYLGTDKAFDHAIARLRRRVRGPERAGLRGLRRGDQDRTRGRRVGGLSRPSRTRALGRPSVDRTRPSSAARRGGSRVPRARGPSPGR